VKSKFFIDFLIAGQGLSFHNIDLQENKPIPQGFYDDLSEAASRYEIFDYFDANFKINVNQKSERITLPAFRYGIKLGYRF